MEHACTYVAEKTEVMAVKFPPARARALKVRFTLQGAFLPRSAVRMAVRDCHTLAGRLDFPVVFRFASHGRQ